MANPNALPKIKQEIKKTNKLTNKKTSVRAENWKFQCIVTANKIETGRQKQGTDNWPDK